MHKGIVFALFHYPALFHLDDQREELSDVVVSCGRCTVVAVNGSIVESAVIEHCTCP